MALRERVQAAREEVRAKATSTKSWVLPKQESSFAPGEVWTNKDNDVTPMDRRTWSSWTVLGFWFSDALNIQGWEAPSSVISIGLTYKEALLCNAFGMCLVAIPLVFNGAIGAYLHVPFPVAIRASFGTRLGKFAVIVRMVTALFWHSIQTFTGSYALTLCISAIWPSYLNIPNHIPESIGLTTQQMVSQLLFWLIQLPVLLISPHKLRYFFIFKAVIVSFACLGAAIGMAKLAGSAGNLFDQTPQIHGAQRVWLIFSAMQSNAGSWATMATNIPDFTRYLKKRRGQWLQGLFLPLISTYLAAMAIVATSASGVLYGQFLWDPTALAAQWNGPGGRAAKFFFGLAWVVGQIGTNLSANVITAANDMTSLFPKYINIRRGAIIITIIGGWVMQPWKIIKSASSLLTFMSGLAIFLAPIAAIQACDFWIVKRKNIDVPALYDPNGIYHYWHGINWRALLAFLCSMIPNLPGLAQAVSPGSVHVNSGILHIYDINYMWGLSSAAFVYVVTSLIWPARETILSSPVLADEILLAKDSSGSSSIEVVDESQNLVFAEGEKTH